MSASRHRRIQDLFCRAKELSPNERAAFLADECQEDTALCHEVESLLEADQGRGLLDHPVAAMLRPADSNRMRGQKVDSTQSFDPKVELDDETESLTGRLLARPRIRDRYRIVGEVGRGGMAVVLLAWDQDLRRQLAMKVAFEDRQVPSNPAAPDLGSRHLARFFEEAQVTGQLDHPGIVPVHEFGIDEKGRVFFTMRLVRGTGLREVFQMVKDGRDDWNLTRALGVILRVCEAVAYAHAKGVIHRDLKPSNVMVGRFGEVYVMDWGLAKVLGREDSHDLRLRPDSTRSIRSDRKEAGRRTPDSPLITMDGCIVGTPSYMSLEQAEGRIDELGPRSDVYSLGAMLYELLAGEPPYVRPGSSPSAHTILAALLDRPPRPIQDLEPGMPAELIAICEKAMARDAARRYESTGELAEDLRAYLEHRVVKAYRTGAVVEFSKWVRRNRGVAVTAGLLVVAVITALSSLYLFEQASKRKVLAAERKTLQKNLELVTTQEEKQRHLADLLELSSAFPDITLRQALLDDADDLWPSGVAAIPLMLDWLDRTSDLVRRGRQTESVLQRVISSQPESDQLARGSVGLSAFFEGLATFEDTGRHGIVANVRERLTFAELVAQDLEDHAETWDDALFEIELGERYGFDMSPQFGLRPLAPDLDTGLWEFVQLLPRRTPTGTIELDAESGPVLVLLPGGSTWVGAQSEDPQAALFDPEALAEWPPREVTFAPFFLSKFEITQGQWENMVLWLPEVESHPSRFPLSDPAASELPFLRRPDPAHLPVEQVSWDECTAVLGCFGLELPTEAQWEYGARGDTDTIWWCGSSTGTVGTSKAGNVYDRTAWEDSGLQLASKPDPWEDGARFTSAVGQFSANDYGLHDTLGNVAEWCRDDPSLEERAWPLRDGDGLALIEGRSQLRIYRGGGWSSPSTFARSAHSEAATIPTRVWNLGLRPSRRITETTR